MFCANKLPTYIFQGITQTITTASICRRSTITTGGNNFVTGYALVHTEHNETVSVGDTVVSLHTRGGEYSWQLETQSPKS